jgi:8-amino-7-oxononanoate synthase
VETAEPSAWLVELDRQAARRAAAGLRRQLRPRAADEATTDLAGNDYLGLARHPRVVAAATQALRGYGLGATGSRLVRGSTHPHAALEQALAGWLGTGFALVFSSGYLANLGAVRALAQPGGLIVSDAHNHASLIDGCRLAGARTVVVPHASPSAVARALADRGGGPALVVTESIFSVDGDLAPLAALHTACREHRALLLVDEAHAVGVLGPRGAGAVAAAGLAAAPDLVVTATLSKAFGASGGLVAGAPALRTHLLDTGRTFIYDTALPPAVAAGALAALEVIRSGDALRAELRDRVASLVQRMSAAGLPVPAPDGAVVSLPAPGPDEALAWAEACRARGVAVGCFRAPSTPDGSSRLRLTVNAGVPRADFDQAVEIILQERPPC